MASLGVLQAMEPVDVPVYDFTSHQRSTTETRRVEPADVIVIEGILVLHIPEVCKRLNMKVYVDTDDDVRLARRCAPREAPAAPPRARRRCLRSVSPGARPMLMCGARQRSF